jgi:hypothetical protein
VHNPIDGRRGGHRILQYYQKDQQIHVPLLPRTEFSLFLI